MYVPRIGRYLSGSTWNLSSGGALLQLDMPAAIEPGDHLFIGVALKRRQPIFCSTEMMEAGVVRVLPTDNDSIALAVNFIETMPGFESELRLAA
jgi:hypothetical protein